MIIKLEDSKTGNEIEGIEFSDDQFAMVPRVGDILHFWEDHVGDKQSDKTFEFEVVEVIHDLRTIFVPGKSRPDSFHHMVILRVKPVPQQWSRK